MTTARGIRAGAAYVELYTKDSGLVKGLRDAEQRLKAFGQGLMTIGTRLAGLGAAVAAPLLASAKVFADMGGDLDDISQRTGVSVEALSELSWAVHLAGTNLETFEAALRKTQRVIVKAAEGGQAAGEVFSSLGIDIGQLSKLSPDEQFKRIATAVSQIEDPALRTATAMEIFGKTGTLLLPMLMTGAAGIERFQEQARQLGLTMSTEDAQAAAAFGDVMDALWKVLRQTSFAIGAALAPLLSQLAQSMTRVAVRTLNWIKDNRSLIVSVAKVTAGVVASGIALSALGASLWVAGAAIGGLASVGIATVAWLSKLTVASAALALVTKSVAAGMHALQSVGLAAAASLAMLRSILVGLSGGLVGLAASAKAVTASLMSLSVATRVSSAAMAGWRVVAGATSTMLIALKAQALAASVSIVWLTKTVRFAAVTSGVMSAAITALHGTLAGLLAATKAVTISLVSLSLATRAGSAAMVLWRSVVGATTAVLAALRTAVVAASLSVGWYVTTVKFAAVTSGVLSAALTALHGVLAALFTATKTATVSLLSFRTAALAVQAGAKLAAAAMVTLRTVSLSTALAIRGLRAVSIASAASWAAMRSGALAYSAAAGVASLASAAVSGSLSLILGPIGLIALALTGATLAFVKFQGVLGTLLSGSLGTAVAWLKDRFVELKSDSVAAFQGISDAMAAGDMSLAAKVLWATIQMEATKGIAALESHWLDFKNWFVGIWNEVGTSIASTLIDAFYSVQSAWVDVSAGMQTAWAETTTGMGILWDQFKNWLSTGSFELTPEQQDQHMAAAGQMSKENQKIEQDRKAAQERLKRDRSGAQAALQEDADRAAQDRIKANQGRASARESELQRARADWQKALAEAAAARANAEKDGKAGPDSLKLPNFDLDGLDDALQTTARKVDVVGTFNPLAAIGSDALSERTAKAAEATAANTKQLVRQFQYSGPAFS